MILSCLQSPYAIARRASTILLIFAIILGFPFLTAAQTPGAGASSDEIRQDTMSSAQGASAPMSDGPQHADAEHRLGKSKIEGTLGALKFQFYGRVLLNVSVADSVEIGQDVPLWPLPGGVPVTFPDGSRLPAGHVHDTIFTARQSVFGFKFSPANSGDDRWTPTGVVEFDFFGTRPVDSLQPQGRVFNEPRLRKAYFQLSKGGYKVVAGQDDMIISPLDPISLSHVGIPLGATAGNLWARLPQVRLDLSHSFGETTTLVQIGVLRPLFADPKLNDLPAVGSAVDSSFSGFGERASAPFYQTRLAVSHPLSGSTATVGVGGHFGSEAVGANRNVHSWALAVDGSIPIFPRLTFRGEGFLGSNLVPFQGGILQGVVVIPNASPNQNTFRQIHPLAGAGGWWELTLRATADNRNNFYVGGSVDNPRTRQLNPGSTRSKNGIAWASYFRKLTSDVTVAFEWSYWQFRTVQFAQTGGRSKGPSGRGNVLNIAFAYDF